MRPTVLAESHWTIYIRGSQLLHQVHPNYFIFFWVNILYTRLPTFSSSTSQTFHSLTGHSIYETPNFFLKYTSTFSFFSLNIPYTRLSLDVHKTKAKYSHERPFWHSWLQQHFVRCWHWQNMFFSFFLILSWAFFKGTATRVLQTFLLIFASFISFQYNSIGSNFPLQCIQFLSVQTR